MARQSARFKVAMPSTGRAEILLFVFALGVRIAVMLVRRSWLHGFNKDYGIVAMNLAAGQGFSLPYNGALAPTAMVAPFVPYLQSVFYRVFGTNSSHDFDNQTLAHVILLLVNFAVHAFAVVLLYRLVVAISKTTENSELPRQVAFVTAAGAAVYPPFIYYSLILNETAWSFVLILLTLLVVLPRPATMLRAAVAGVVLGGAALVHPTNFFVFIPIAGWMATRRQGGPRRAFVSALMFLLGAGVSMSPWLIRNYLVFGKFVPIKSNLGICMYVLNRPGATGVNWPYQHDDILPLYNERPGPFVSKVLSNELNARVALMPEVEKQYFFFRETLRIIGERPGRYLALSMKRLVVYLTFPFGRSNRPTYDTPRGIASMAGFIPVLLLAIAGLAAGTRTTPEAKLVAACAVSLAVGFALLYVGDLRYKLPFENLLFALAGTGVLRVVTARLGRTNAGEAPRAASNGSPE